MTISYPRNKPRVYLSPQYLETRIQKQKNMTSLQNSKSGKINSSLLSTFSLRPYCRFIYDQGSLGSCTANAYASAYCIMEYKKYKRIRHQPSRLFFYFIERWMENQYQLEGLTDSGADVVDGLSYAKTFGISSESCWPYDISKFNIKPPLPCFNEALLHKIADYSVLSIDDQIVNTIRQYLYRNQSPVLIAMKVFSNFESTFTSKTGLILFPKGYFLGGHEMCILGYDDLKKHFIVLNSWGNQWGDRGYCYLPYAYCNPLSNIYQVTTFSIF